MVISRLHRGFTTGPVARTLPQSRLGPPPQEPIGQLGQAELMEPPQLAPTKKRMSTAVDSGSVERRMVSPRMGRECLTTGDLMFAGV